MDRSDDVLDDGLVRERLQQQLSQAVEGVQTPPWLAAAAARGGRRRARRRRVLTTALISAPVAVAAVTVVVSGAASPAGWLTPQPSSRNAASSTVAGPTASSPTDPDVGTSVTSGVIDPAELSATERAARAVAATEELARAQVTKQNQQWASQLAKEGEPELAAFFGAGYDYDDALTLGQLWKLDPSQAKVSAGTDLIAGQVLPISPSTDISRVSPGWEVTAFAAAGYTLQDADRLAAVWGLDEWDTQVEGGRRLLKGEVLPLDPSGDATGSDGAVTGGEGGANPQPTSGRP